MTIGFEPATYNQWIMTEPFSCVYCSLTLIALWQIHKRKFGCEQTKVFGL